MSDYLTDDEQAEALKKWWKDHGIPVVLAVVVGIAAVVGWHFYQDYSSTKNQNAADAFADYLESRGLGLPVDEHVELLESQYDDSGYLLLLYLYQAKDAIADEDYEKALTSLESAKDLGAGTHLNDLVSIRRAKVLFQLDRTDEALGVLQSVSSQRFRSIALEFQGDIYRTTKSIEKARESYLASIEALSEDLSPDILHQKLGVLAAK